MFLNKKNILIFLLLITPLFIISGENFSTFPEDYAGITAYTKTTDIHSENNLIKLTELVAFLEGHPKGVVVESKDTHVIGKFTVDFTVFDNQTENENYPSFSLSPYIYIDKDGWIASYFNKSTPSSSIINWEDYDKEEVPVSILEKVIAAVTEGVEISFGEINYHHFAFPEANAMSIVIDNINNLDGTGKNNHSITLPSDPEEASYSISYTNRLLSYKRCIIDIFVDGENIEKSISRSLTCRGEEYIYREYPENTFIKNKPHSVLIEGIGGGLGSTKIHFGLGSVFIYQN